MVCCVGQLIRQDERTYQVITKVTCQDVHGKFRLVITRGNRGSRYSSFPAYTAQNLPPEDNHHRAIISLFVCGRGACVYRVQYAAPLARNTHFMGHHSLACGKSSKEERRVKTPSSISGVHAFHKSPALRFEMANETVSRNL
ncbi:hypothetical protein TNCV_2205861 [Trichonephila clavipes]|nr:hypothetical protein TNCV_2205861 [Trichonephila clavipes]